MDVYVDGQKIDTRVSYLAYHTNALFCCYVDDRVNLLVKVCRHILISMVLMLT